MLMRKRSSMAVSSSSNKNNPSSQFASSILLLGFSAKPSSDSEQAASPTSILETKLFSRTVNPFFTGRKTRPTWQSAESSAVGLGIVDAFRNEKPEIHRKCSNLDSRMVLFGSQHKIQIPLMHPTSVSTARLAESPGSPIEFGVKNKSSQLALHSPALWSPMAYYVDMGPPSSDMVLSENYTCVIAHGPNPRTTHIFDNCILESCGTSHCHFSSSREKSPLACRSVDFLDFCNACNKGLGPGRDLLIYRGEKAFCSNECEILFVKGIENAS